MSRVLVCGGRNYYNQSRVDQVLDAAVERLSLAVVIQGAARGADEAAIDWAIRRGVEFTSFHADWETMGKRAGWARNQRMLDEGKPDVIIAFPGGRGTADMVKRAESAGVRVIRIDWNA